MTSKVLFDSSVTHEKLLKYLFEIEVLKTFKQITKR